jgi:hypothetical protein
VVARKAACGPPKPIGTPNLAVERVKEKIDGWKRGWQDKIGEGKGRKIKLMR